MWDLILIGLLVLVIIRLSYKYYIEEIYTPNRPLQVGDLVTTTFYGCPAVITRAAYGQDGSEMNYEPAHASVSVMFCDFPDVPRNYPDISSQTSWIADAGVNKSAASSVCKEAHAFPGMTASCTSDNDCQLTMYCDPSSMTACSNTICSSDDCPSGQQNSMCPCGIGCTQKASGSYTCDLKTQTTFPCDKSTGICMLSTDSCPPPPTCNVFGRLMTVTAAGYQQTINSCVYANVPSNGTSNGNPTYPNVDPCTGCYVGQTCDVFDAGTGEGSCTGLAKMYVPINVLFKAEGTIQGIDPERGASVQWERVQCQHPFAVTQNMNLNTVTKQPIQPYECPFLFQGCVVNTGLGQSSFNSIVFGDAASGQPPTLPEDFLLFQDLSNAPLWPLSIYIEDPGMYGTKTLPNSTFTVMPISTYTIPLDALGITKNCTLLNPTQSTVSANSPFAPNPPF